MINTSGYSVPEYRILILPDVVEEKTSFDVILEGSNALHAVPYGGIQRGFSYVQSLGHVCVADDTIICGFKRNL